MAPTFAGKRRSPEDFDDFEREAEASSSRQPRNSSKRPRLAGDGDGYVSREDDAMSDVSNEVSNEEDAAPARGGSNVFNYEAYRDADIEDDPMDEENIVENQRAIQVNRARNRYSVEDREPAENAIIERIDCTNFMCHSRLTLDLGPLINFIIGHNGSGKSAALTALQLCLGTKVSGTNRGGKLADFIKHGEDWASISVRIKNQGQSAYMPELYGPSITVERHFTKNGQSGFKLKNSQGKIVSNKKGELEGILDAFQLQLDNPMMCLTQDGAREFINDSGPSQKYNFFFKGTQLEALDRDYKIMSSNLEHLVDIVDDLSEDKQAAKREYQAAGKKLEDAQELEGLTEKHRTYSRQCAWVQVEAQERLLKEFEENVVKAEEKIQSLQVQAEKISEDYDRANDAHTEATGALDEMQRSRGPHEDEKAPLDEEFKNNKKELEHILAQERELKGTIGSSRKRARDLERKIQDEERRIAERDGGQHAQLLDDWQAAKAEAERIERDFHAHSGGFANLEKTKKDAEQAILPAKESVFKVRGEIEQTRQRINELESGRGRWMTAYKFGENKLPALLNAIDNESRFREKPIGPLGRYIRLLKPEWSTILERAFGNTLNAFVCVNKADQLILTAHMKRLGCPCDTYIGNATPINTTATEPEPGVLTWMRALEFESEIVRNQCIINQAVDQIVLIQDPKEGQDFIDESPKHVRAVYIMHQLKNGDGFRLSKGSGNSDARTPVRKWAGSTRMKTDSEHQMKTEHQRLQDLNREVKDAEQQQRQAEMAAKEAREALVRYQRANKDLNNQVKEAKLRAAELQDKLEEAQPQGDQLDALGQQLQETNNEIANAKAQFEDCYNAKDDLNKKQRMLMENVSRIDEALKQIDDNVAKLTIKARRLAEKRETALRKKNEAFERIRDAEDDKTASVANVQQQHETVKGFTEAANEISRRVNVDPGLTKEKIDKMLHETEKQIERARNQLGGDRNQLLQRKLETKRRFNMIKKRFETIDNVFRMLKKARSYRIDRWKAFRKFISLRAKTQFTFLLSFRSYRGHLNFNHKDKLLDIQIEPDIARRSDKGRQTKTLSGGEKSFSTICMLLALWEAMGSPIRCLDEFDVFMDQVNRAVTVDMIIDGARDSGSKQFILISPQSMKQDIMKKDVTVIKMNDPERGQRALPDSYGPR